MSTAANEQPGPISGDDRSTDTASATRPLDAETWETDAERGTLTLISGDTSMVLPLDADVVDAVTDAAARAGIAYGPTLEELPEPDWDDDWDDEDEEDDELSFGERASRVSGWHVFNRAWDSSSPTARRVVPAVLVVLTVLILLIQALR